MTMAVAKPIFCKLKLKHLVTSHLLDSEQTHQDGFCRMGIIEIDVDSFFHGIIRLGEAVLCCGAAWLGLHLAVFSPTRHLGR